MGIFKTVTKRMKKAFGIASVPTANKQKPLETLGISEYFDAIEAQQANRELSLRAQRDALKEQVKSAPEQESDEFYSPHEYFAHVKGKTHEVSDEMLDKVYANCMALAEKYKLTGQNAGLKKLIFHMECIAKERELVKAGVSTFVYRDDIEEFIDNVADKAVKITELDVYEREIPDEIVEVLRKVGSLFDKKYVLFTDYTGKEEKRVAKERRAKDPILFGTFQNESSRTLVDRFYYLGDWEDEYCDLTLDKMVGQVLDKTSRQIAHTISTPGDLDELRAQLHNLEKQPDDTYLVVEKPKQEFSQINVGLSGDV